MVHESVKRLDARHANAGLRSDLDGRPQIRLNLHRSPGGVVLVHYTAVVGGTEHGLNCPLFEIAGEVAVLCRCNTDQFVDDIGYHRTDANLLDQFGVDGRLEEDTGRMEGDRASMAVKSAGAAANVGRLPDKWIRGNAHPIIL